MMVSAANNDGPAARMDRQARLDHLQRSLHSRMLELGLSQADVCRLAGFGRDSMSRYTRGMTLPEPPILMSLARALQVDPTELDPGAVRERLRFAAPAVAAEPPTMEISQDPANPGRLFVRLNQSLPFETASKIMLLLQEARKGSDDS